MKKLSLSLIWMVLGVVLVVPLSGVAQKTNKAAEREVVGYISDNHCGLKHISGMGDDKSCTLMCMKHGKFVLADRDHKRVHLPENGDTLRAGGFGAGWKQHAWEGRR
ncbi:MAG: hypothetical protein M3R52_03600 [Acidobacteriota bacterium]|nr:hypothetical protein [Acidobacteriota bacterium]